MCGISRGLQVRRNCWFAWLLRGPLPKTDWEADASHGVSRWSHCWTRCHLFNSPSEWDTVCVQSACLRVVPAVNQNPYLPRGPVDSSATAVSAEAFWLLENRHHICTVSCILFYIRSQHEPSSIDKTRFLWLSQTSPLLDPGCFNNKTLRRCRVTRSTNQQLGHVMRVGVYKTPVWLISHC